MNLQQTFTSRNGRCQNRNIILQTHQHLIVLPSPSSPSRRDLFSCVSDISNKLMIYNFPSRVSFGLTEGELRCPVSNSIMNSLPGSRLSYFKALRGPGPSPAIVSPVPCPCIFLTTTLWSRI